jgi:hypothetical protein
MSQLNTLMAIFAVVAAAGIIGTVAVVFLATAESADAWHSVFGSKKECTNYMKRHYGNTIAQANFICQKVIAHW